MLTFLEICGLYCGAALLVSVLFKDLVQVVNKVFNVALVPLKTADAKLGAATDRTSHIVREYGTFTAYLIPILVLTFGALASLGDFFLTRFGLEILGIGEVTVARTALGKFSATAVLALLIIAGLWLLSLYDRKEKELIEHKRQQGGSDAIKKANRRISGYMIAFLGIAIIQTGLAYFRTLELEPETQMPLVHTLSGLSVEGKAIIAASITMFTSLMIYLAGRELGAGLQAIILIVLIIVLTILAGIKTIIWFSLTLITGMSLVLLGIMSLLKSSGDSLIKGMKSLRKGSSSNLSILLVPIILGGFLFYSGCLCIDEYTDNTEIVLILDISGSFAPLLGKAVDKCTQIIDSLPPNSEFIAIKIDDRSYRQCKEIVHLKIPPRTERQTYAKRARVEYDNVVNKLKRAAIDSLQKVLAISSSPATDIWGAIAYSSTLFSDSVSDKLLIIMSDFLHNTEAIKDSTSSFKGIKVWALFVEHATDSPSEYKARIAQYEEYFIKRGALSVKFFDPIATSMLNVQNLLEVNELQGGGQ